MSLDTADFNYDNMDKSTPVLIMGGRENALSLVRRFGAAGIKTRVTGPLDCWGMNSRYCSKSYPVPKNQPDEVYWQELLLSDNHPELHNSLLIPGSDVAINFIARNRPKLETRFLIVHNTAKMQLALLDKRETLKLAKSAGVATPNFWDVENEDDLDRIRQSIVFPVMVKPIISHEFIKVFGQKLFIIENDFDQLAEKVRLSWAENLEVMVIEMIPGPDAQLSSYYTYIDKNHHSHFDYTKCVVRRYPVNRGLACFHKNTWLPETANAGRKFFQGIGFTGFGNIEFKLDPRDNVLKVIEANARFTAAQELIVQSGAPIDFIYYCVATGQPAPEFSTYNENLTFWYGLRDVLAFLEMKKSGSITAKQWIQSLFPLRHVPPLHNIKDLYPSIAAITARVEKTVLNLL
jgi:D-aspartate ligase